MFYKDADSSAVPYHQQKILPDWPRTLAMSLARLVGPSVHEILADDWVGSKGSSTAMRMMVATRCSPNVARMFADKAEVS